jgi:predicted AAA+ superfamily ATPase
MDFKRLLDIELPEGQSAFLWGPRKTGKTFYLRQRFPQSIVYDFLDTDTFFELSKRPALLREQLLARPAGDLRHPVILDEVQKVPALLDEVHWLIENKKLRFILCGSSARKLVRAHANLLGGRAWRYELFPLVFPEIGKADLLRALNHGTIPLHYLEEESACKRSLKGYLQDYMKEEVFAEGLARNIPAFSKFLDAVGYGHGELVNYANISRECGIDAKTVKEYYQILSDTLLGSFLEPFKKRQSRDVIGKAPKFYLFDVGVAGTLCKRTLAEARGEQFGRAFEHFIYLEIKAYRSYRECDFRINFWRTKSGLETDFILGDGEVAVEVKGTDRVDGRDLRGIKAFVETNRPRAAYIVSNERTPRLSGGITILPWRVFLEKLWSGELIK